MHLLLPWILAALSIALLLGAGLLLLLNRHGRRLRALPADWALAPRPVFSVDERRAYRHLREALPHHVVLSKLPLVRFCQPTDPHEVRYWYELIGTSHVTFAICSPSGRVLAAIDLDTEPAPSDRSVHVKQAVLGACRVRYLRCSAELLPSTHELQLLVPHSVGAGRGPQPAPTTPVPPTPFPAQEPGATPSLRPRARATLWQDSGFMQDSLYGVQPAGDHEPRDGPSRSAPWRQGHERAPAPADVGEVWVDRPRGRMQH